MTCACCSATVSCRSSTSEKEPCSGAGAQEDLAPLKQNPNTNTFLSSQPATITTTVSDESTSPGADHIIPIFGHRHKSYPPCLQLNTNSESTRTACTGPRTTCCDKGSCPTPFPPLAENYCLTGMSRDIPLRRLFNTHGSEHNSTIRANHRGERHPNTERFVLVVGGLSCSCCATGIDKALDQIPAVQAYQINLVLARVEVDLDVHQDSIEAVRKKLHTATGYKFEEYIQSDGQVLELLVNDPDFVRQVKPPNGAILLNDPTKQSWARSRLFSGRSSAAPVETRSPSTSRELSGDGATEGIELTKNAPLAGRRTVRIQYDAKVVGARDVLQYYVNLLPDEDVQLAPPTAHPSVAEGVKRANRAAIISFASLVFTVPVLVLAWLPSHTKKMSFEHASLALATAVQAIGLREFSPGAVRALFRFGVLGMDLLVTLSTTIAYIFSVISYVFEVVGHPLETGCFFETSTLLVTLILLGRAIVEAARYRAAKSVSFRSLQVEEALLVLPGGAPNNPKTRRIDARLLQYGDRFKVVPHSRIVTDGEVSYGGSEVDESMITGESVPVAKGNDSPVYAGTVNGKGTLIVTLTALPHENSISKIATLVESAELTKPKAQALADRIAALFVPVIAATSLAVFLAWLLVDRFLHARPWSKAAVHAMTYAIATLIVSCPCAIGLAVPMVILIASSVAARFGIIFRDPAKLETARRVTDVVFDKTGTLTTGRLVVVHYKHYSDALPTPLLVRTLLGLLAGSTHPVARAVLDWASEKALEASPSLAPLALRDVTSTMAEGIEGTTPDGRTVRAGSPRFARVSALDSEHTLLCVSLDGQHAATFRLKDAVRHAARPTITRLLARGITPHVLSGDTQGAVNSVAFTLGIVPGNALGGQRPGDKQAYVAGLQRDAGARRTVLFVGDGANDAVALKQAHVGVHVAHEGNAGATDVAQGAADVVLRNACLFDVLTLLDVSRAAYRRIVANFVWCGVYNGVAVLMAAGAFVRVRIEPAWAGLGELVSVLPVVVVAFSVRWGRYGSRRRGEWDGDGEGKGVKKVGRGWS